MISVIYGPKGSGKTRRIIDATNTAAEKATGKVIYIADNGQSLGISPNVKFINLNEYEIANEDQFVGFMKGMLAADFDIQNIFIDGLSRLLKLPAEELKPVFDAFAKVADKIDFAVTVSADTLPAFLKPYAVKG